MNKTELLGKLSTSPEERLVLARAMDKLDLAQNRGVPAHTPFLSLAEQDGVARLLAACGHPGHLFWGGWEGAERKLCAFPPDWMEAEAFQTGEECPITAVTVAVPPDAKPTHRDYLGAILGLGLTREKIGDLLVGEGTCQVLLLREVEHVLLTQLDQVGRWRVRVSPCPLAELRPPEQKVKVIRDTVAALRLDAVASTAGSATSPTGRWRRGTCSPAGGWESACSRRSPAPPKRGGSCWCWNGTCEPPYGKEDC